MQKLNLRRIVAILAAHKSRLRRKYGIKSMAVFGSFVYGSPKRGSDVDILIDFEEIPDLLQFIEIENHLGTLIHRNVDLVRKQALREELKDLVRKAVPV